MPQNYQLGFITKQIINSCLGVLFTWLTDNDHHRVGMFCMVLEVCPSLRRYLPLLCVSQVKDVVGYDTLGHCFFLEDGVEQRNTFYHNLGLLTRPGTILPTDRDETMCLSIRAAVYGDYTPSPSTDCM